MNTHEAIKTLLHTAWLGSDGDREKIEQAIEVVAEALEQSCDNDCEHCEWVTCPKMEQEPSEDLISRQDAIKVIEKCKAELTKPGDGLLYAKLKRLINECPNGE